MITASLSTLDQGFALTEPGQRYPVTDERAKKEPRKFGILCNRIAEAEAADTRLREWDILAAQRPLTADEITAWETAASEAEYTRHDADLAFVLITMNVLES